MYKPLVLVLVCLLCFILGLATALKNPDFFGGAGEKNPIHTLPVPPKTTPYEKSETGSSIMLYLGPGVSLQAVDGSACGAKP